MCLRDATKPLLLSNRTKSERLFVITASCLTLWELLTVLQQPYKQLGKVAVAEPGVALQTKDPEGRQGFQDANVQLCEAILLQLQLPQRGQTRESVPANHVQVGVVPQSQFDQTPGLSKGPRGDFRQVVAPQVQEDQSGGTAESPRFQLREGVVPQVQIDQITVEDQEV